MRRRNSGNPRPSSASSTAVRPTAAIISCGARPRISCPSPHVRSMSVAFNRIPRSRPSGTRPIGTGPVKKSSAVAVDSGSRSKGSPSGILMSPLWAKTSASRPGACGGGLQYRLSARSRRLDAISIAGRSAQRRASSSIARSGLPRRTPSHVTLPVPSIRKLTKCAPTVFTSQPAHRLGVASCASSRPSIRSAMRRRSCAVAAWI